MHEEFWSETTRLMDLAADCRATIAKTRAMVDQSWTVLQAVDASDPILTNDNAPRSWFDAPSPPLRETIREPASEVVTLRPISTLVPWSSAARPMIVNRLLRELPQETLDLLLSKATRVKLKRGQVLEHPRMAVQYAYFVESGIASLQAVSPGNGLLASGLVGSDGMTGLPIVLRSMKTPLKAQVHIAGEAWRIAAEDLQSCLERRGPLLDLLLSYVQTMLVQSAYVGLCGARHSARQRIRSWLLLAVAALDRDEIVITHQAVAKLLGLRRATVSDCLAELQRSSAIRQKRGCVEVLDAEKLAQGACDCHRFIGAEFNRLWLKPLAGAEIRTRASG
jgi:CRP-like cAMP-binding protein